MTDADAKHPPPLAWTLLGWSVLQALALTWLSDSAAGLAFQQTVAGEGAPSISRLLAVANLATLAIAVHTLLDWLFAPGVPPAPSA